MTARAALPRFERARKPEQIALRREAILAAAAELFDAGGPEAAGLNAIAARAGFTKSNVYRYFESREAALLSLFTAEFERFVQALGPALVPVRSGDMEGVARVTAELFLAHPRFCHLLSILNAVIERNVSEDVLVDMKRTTYAMAQQVAQALHAKLPAIPLADCAWAGTMVATLVTGMWTSARPTEAAKRIFERPEFAGLKPNLGRDLERAVLVLLRGVAPG
jgi:AcrR family transcriptional regulator